MAREIKEGFRGVSTSGLEKLRPSAPAASGKVAAAKPAIPDYIRAVATYGAGASPDLPTAAYMAYRAIEWVVRTGVLKDKQVGHHLYDLVRSGLVPDALADLQGRLAQHSDGDPMIGTSCRLPQGLGSVYTKCLWAEASGTGRAGVNSWLLKNLQESDAAAVTGRISGIVGDAAAAARTPRSDKPYLAATLLTNVTRLESLVKGGKAGALSVGALLLVELAKDLKALAAGMDDQSWVSAKALRLAMQTTAISLSDSGSTDEARTKNRRTQLRLLSLPERKLEECAELGKLVSQELSWNRAKSGALYSRAATVLNVLFVNAFGPEKLRLASELKPAGKVLDDLVGSYAPGGLVAYESLDGYLKVSCPALLGRGTGAGKAPRSTSSLVRMLSRDPESASFVSQNIDIPALPDPFLAALAARLPALLDTVPAERVARLAGTYVQQYDTLYRPRGVKLGPEAYARYERHRGHMMQDDLLADVARVVHGSTGPLLRKLCVQAELTLDKGWQTHDIPLWASQGALGLPSGLSIGYSDINGSAATLLVSYLGQDWPGACTVGDIVAWLRNRGLVSSFGGFTFTMLCDDVTPSRWEGAVEFLDSNALALGSYFRVPPDRFRYPVRSYKDIQLLPRAARVKLHEGVLFNMPLHVAGSWISGGSGVHWDSLESLRVAVGFLEAALRWCGGDMGEYIFPSTFLRRVGLKGDLFGEVRDGKGAPAGADIWPGVATGH